MKVGPAFFDYVSDTGNKKRFRKQNFELSGILTLLPLLLLILSMGIITARLFYLQVIRASYYQDLSDNNRTRTKIISAPRGIIYDRNNKPLVSNSQIFEMEEEGESTPIESGSTPIESGSKIIPREEALELISQGNKKIKSEIKREYLYKDAFAHVLGYLGPVSKEEVMLPTFAEYSSSENVGKMGIEKTYEKLLHGKNGKELFEVDAQGKSIRSLGQKEPENGQNLKTTLDLNLQLAARDAMAQIGRGAVIASDPRTGGILALYSKASFDPNVFTLRSSSNSYSGDYQSAEDILSDTENLPLLNRAIGGVYPPGSTFKLVTAVAALSRGAIKKDTIIEDTGILKVGDFSFGNWYFLQYGKTDGVIDVVAAIKRSNDIFFYKTAEKAGVENISSFARDFGMGEKSGIDLLGEVGGTVPSPSWKEKVIGEQWYLGDTYNYGIGQGYLLATPLQVNSMTNVFANGGTLYKPHLVSSQRKVLKKNLVKKDYIELVKKGMLESCEEGGVAWPFFGFKIKNERLKIDNKDLIEDASGSARIVRIPVACKTGTAETGDKDTKPHAWITVFAPYYNPEIVLTVLVENGGEGSSVAGPIAKKILQDYFEKK